MIGIHKKDVCNTELHVKSYIGLHLKITNMRIFSSFHDICKTQRNFYMFEHTPKIKRRL